MLGWIFGYVRRWAGYVADPVIDLVHWGLHAIAGVVYTVFGHVGAAWREVFDAASNLWHWTEAATSWIWKHLSAIILVDLPRIWRYATSWVRWLAHQVAWVYDQARALVLAATRYAERLVAGAVRWVLVNVWDPLKRLADAIYRDLLKWGYTAWWWITHPDKLASMLLQYLVTAFQEQFDLVAAPVGIFLLRVVVRTLPRFLRLIETIVLAVL